MMKGSVGGPEASLFVVVYAFPVLSFPLFLLYLRAPLPGKVGSWAILAGAFLAYMFVYRHSCHQRGLCFDASLIVFARCTLALAWYLRLMFVSAVILQLSAPENSVTRALRRLEG
jgi:hypothetical protein